MSGRSTLLRRALAGRLLVASALAWSLAAGAADADEGGNGEVGALVDQAGKLLRKGKLDEAVETLRAADEAAGGESAEVLRLLAVVHRRKGDGEGELASTLRLFRLDPAREGFTLRTLVHAYQRREEPGEILSLLREFLEAGPETEDAVWAHNEVGYWMVVSAEAAGEPVSAEANRAFFRAFDLSEGGAGVAALNLAETLRRQGHEAEAREILEEVSSPPEGTRHRLRALPLGGELAQRWEERGPKRSAGRPVRVSSPSPEYTEEARKARIQGVVVLRLQVDTAGRHRVLEVLHGLPMGLTEAAIEAVERWRFEPARDEAGNPVESETEVSLSFMIQ